MVNLLSKNLLSQKTHEDAEWEYGETLENGVRLSTWMKPKSDWWFNKKQADIIVDFMGIPLNQEMLKQIGSYEGDTKFLYRLTHMCKPTDIELTEKQINFMARILLSNNDINVLALRHFCVSGLKAGVATKDIEKKLKEIRAKHETTDG